MPATILERQVIPDIRRVMDGDRFRPLTDAGAADEIAAYVARYEDCQLDASGLLERVHDVLARSKTHGQVAVLDARCAQRVADAGMSLALQQRLPQDAYESFKQARASR